jgi:hypothetical protein
MIKFDDYFLPGGLKTGDKRGKRNSESINN